MDKSLIIIIVSVIVSLILLVLFSALFLYFKKKNQKSTVNPSFIEALALALGSKANILSVEAEQGRLKIEVNNLDIVNLEQIKELTGSGVFLTGNFIKLLVRENALEIKNELTK